MFLSLFLSTGYEDQLRHKCTSFAEVMSFWSPSAILISLSAKASILDILSSMQTSGRAFTSRGYLMFTIFENLAELNNYS